jgi:hypothetical protein
MMHLPSWPSDSGERFRDEADFLAQVIRAARQMGWLCYHTRWSIESEPGFPDVCMVNRRQQRVLFAELKNDHRSLTTEQMRWLTALQETGKVEVYFWRFCHWGKLLEILAQKPDLSVEEDDAKREH